MVCLLWGFGRNTDRIIKATHCISIGSDDCLVPPGVFLHAEVQYMYSVHWLINSTTWLAKIRQLRWCHFSWTSPDTTPFKNCRLFHLACHIFNGINQDVADNKVRVANMGPTCVLSAPGGPHVDPMNLVIRGGLVSETPDSNKYGSDQGYHAGLLL